MRDRCATVTFRYFPLLSVTRFTYGKFDSTCYGILHFGYDAADSFGIYSGGKPVYTLVSSKRRRAVVGAEGTGGLPRSSFAADICNQRQARAVGFWWGLCINKKGQRVRRSRARTLNHTQGHCDSSNSLRRRASGVFASCSSVADKSTISWQNDCAFAHKATAF